MLASSAVACGTDGTDDGSAVGTGGNGGAERAGSGEGLGDGTRGGEGGGASGQADEDYADCTSCLAARCANDLAGCSNNASCSTFGDCLSPCLASAEGFEECLGACIDAEPEGTLRYYYLNDCIANSCPSTCFDANPMADFYAPPDSGLDRYPDNEDGTVLDTETGLFWIVTPPEDTFGFNAAGAYCDELSFAGRDDWRVPTIVELASILTSDAGTGAGFAGGCSWPGVLAGDCTSARYWSSTQTDDGTVSDVGFLFGTVGSTSPDSERYVRCVSGG